MYTTSVISNQGIFPVVDRMILESCANCKTKLDMSKQRITDEIPCPVCGQVINSNGEILTDGRDLSLPQIY